MTKLVIITLVAALAVFADATQISIGPLKLGKKTPEIVDSDELIKTISKIILQLRKKPFQGLEGPNGTEIQDVDGATGEKGDFSSVSFHDLDLKGVEIRREGSIKGKGDQVRTTLSILPKTLEGYIKWSQEGRGQGDDKFTIPIGDDIKIDVHFKTKKGKVKMISAKASSAFATLDIEPEDVKLSCNIEKGKENPCDELREFISMNLTFRLRRAVAKKLSDLMEGLDANM